MPNAGAEARGWLAPALAGVVAITALRVALLSANRTDLFVDEAQYWLWSQSLDFGYFSKPPLIAWVIRAVTELAGSDAAFWVRLPAPLFHAATALLLAASAALLAGRRAAVVVALGYATLPIVAVGSLLFSTDTVMFPFLALALCLHLRLLGFGGDRGGAVTAALTGLALGLAFLAKYAALYYLGLGALAALMVPALRPGLKPALALLAAFAVTISPNVLWNLWHETTTLDHTAGNVGWIGEGMRLDPAGLAAFLGAQAAAFGPVPLAALLWLGWQAVRGRAAMPGLGLLLWLSLPILALVSAQGLVARAYANWAAAAYLAGSVAVFPALLARPRWLAASFVLNGALSLALPMATVYADSFRLAGKPVLARHLGRAQMSETLIARASAEGATAIVADSRDILADLFHTGRGLPMPFFAWPPEEAPAHHYAQNHAYAGQTAGPVLVVTWRTEPPPCGTRATALPGLSGGEGAYSGRRLALYLAPADCWETP